MIKRIINLYKNQIVYTFKTLESELSDRNDSIVIIVQ